MTHPVRLATLSVLLLAGAACDSNPANANYTEASEGAVAEAATDAAATPPPAAPQTAAKPLSESDRMFLDMATAACAQTDFNGFFAAYARSAEVQARYTASSVRTGTRGASAATPRAQYLSRNAFPVGMIDTYWVTGESKRQFLADDTRPEVLVNADLQINVAGDRRAIVEWQPGRMDIQPGDEGEGTFVATGPGGYTLFYPTETCWELVEDIRETR